MNSSLAVVKRRNILDVLQSSFSDHKTNVSGENQVRYKLIIDQIGDGSVMLLLSLFDVLQYDNTRMYVLSKFSEDAHLQEVSLKFFNLHYIRV